MVTEERAPPPSERRSCKAHLWIWSPGHPLGLEAVLLLQAEHVGVTIRVKITIVRAESVEVRMIQAPVVENLRIQADLGPGIQIGSPPLVALALRQTGSALGLLD